MSVLSDRKHHKLESNLNMLMDEYKLISSGSEMYFSLMYLCINFTFAFYGAIVTLGQNLFLKDSASNTSVVVFFYLIPISTYILGLFYAYNSVALSKYGYFSIRIENDIIELNRRLGFVKYLHGWNNFAKKMPGGFILPYGTMLAFYLLMPPVSVFYGVFLITTGEFEHSNALIYGILYILPGIFYVIYLAFMSYLVYYMFKFKRMYDYAKKQKTLQYETDIYL